MRSSRFARRRSLLVILASVAALGASTQLGGSAQALPAANEWAGTWNTNWGPMVLQQSGSRLTGTYTHDSGRIEGSQMGANRVFKGIPYAAPPVGTLRWRPPQPVAPWRGVRMATAYSSACPQPGKYPPDAPQESTSEDCLTLNVWAPALKDAVA